MGTITRDDGIEIFYKDWGSGQPIVFSHGWPLSADDWDTQMLFFLQQGYRVIAHDRRGHGRSTQTGDGHDMDHYADDLAALTAHLDLQDAVHVKAGRASRHGWPTGDREKCERVRQRLTRVPSAQVNHGSLPTKLTAQVPGVVPKHFSSSNVSGRDKKGRRWHRRERPAPRTS